MKKRKPGRLFRKKKTNNEADKDQRGTLDVGKQIRQNIKEILAQPKRSKKTKKLLRLFESL